MIARLVQQLQALRHGVVEAGSAGGLPSLRYLFWEKFELDEGFQLYHSPFRLLPYTNLGKRYVVVCVSFDSEESFCSPDGSARRGALEAGGPCLQGASSLQRLGIDFALTHPVRDSNPRPPASESQP